jgi:hypothetical protein
MRRHPVDNDTNAGRVTAIHEVTEIVRVAEALRRCVHADWLVAPRTVERVLRHGQQFHVRETHVAYIVDKFVGEFAVAQITVAALGPAPPGAEVHFVDTDRPVEFRTRGAALHPRVVRPLVFAREHDGCVAGRRLVVMPERVVLQRQKVTFVVEQFELVFLAAADPRDEYFP